MAKAFLCMSVGITILAIKSLCLVTRLVIKRLPNDLAIFEVAILRSTVPVRIDSCHPDNWWLVAAEIVSI